MGISFNRRLIMIGFHHFVNKIGHICGTKVIHIGLAKITQKWVVKKGVDVKENNN